MSNENECKDENIDRAAHLIPEAEKIHAKYPLFDGHNGKKPYPLI